MDRGDGLRVVGCEHRVDRVGRVQQATRAGLIRHVGVRFAGEHRIAALTVDLGAFHFAVPIRAFDQAHRNDAAQSTRHIGDVVNHKRRAFLIRLHDDAEPVPTLQRGVGHHLKNQVEREFQPLGFLSVDGQPDAVLPGELRQLQQARAEFTQHARTLGVFIAGMQRGQLDRDAGNSEHIRSGEIAALADGMDRHPIGFEIAQTVGSGQRTFAQHVERIAVASVVALAAAAQCFIDGAAHHELVAHDPHRLAHCEPDHRFADAADQAFERVVHVAFGVVVEIDEGAGQHQAPGRGIDQHRVGLAHMPFPVGIAQFVADQFVGCVLVRNAQQRLSHAHQEDAFFAAEVVLTHEGFDRALVLRPGANPADQIRCRGLDGGAIRVGLARGGEQFVHMFGFVADPGGGDRGAQRIRRRRQFGRQDLVEGRAGGRGVERVHGGLASG